MHIKKTGGTVFASSTSLEGTFSENEKASGIYLTPYTDSFVVQRGNENKNIKILKCYIQGGIAITVTVV